METQAAAHRAKKRRSEAPESPKLERTGDISSPAPHPPSAGGDQSLRQEPHPGGGGGGGEGGGEDGVDYTSRLPDAVLGEVISLLPTKDAARTQIFASQWRHLWRSAPLNLDGGDLPTGGYPLAFAGIVSRILSAHGGPGRLFSVPAQHLQDRPATVDAWLRSPALDNLEEIDLWDEAYRWEVLQSPTLPASTFRFASCLRVATLSQCRLPGDITQTIRFPQLKKLALQQVCISEDSLHSLIAGCPVLECLLLNKNFGFRCVQIKSPSITTIGLGPRRYDNAASLEEFIIEDAPCLERFLYLQGRTDLQVSVITAPKLQTLGPLCFRDTHSRLTLGLGLYHS